MIYEFLEQMNASFEQMNASFLLSCWCTSHLKLLWLVLEAQVVAMPLRHSQDRWWCRSRPAFLIMHYLRKVSDSVKAHLNENPETHHISGGSLPSAIAGSVAVEETRLPHVATTWAKMVGKLLWYRTELKLKRSDPINLGEWLLNPPSNKKQLLLAADFKKNNNPYEYIAAAI